MASQAFPLAALEDVCSLDDTNPMLSHAIGASQTILGTPDVADPIDPG